eukprot:m.432442 g.432442  ORF g.432442 m.432442 type:complete len:53 (-) comp17435_c0_seq1:124-282(-)
MSHLEPAFNFTADRITVSVTAAAKPIEMPIAPLAPAFAFPPSLVPTMNPTAG